MQNESNNANTTFTGASAIPLLSVIVPVYNVEKYLDKCLESILASTYENLEIILVDDGSSDSSPKLCDEYSEKHPNIHVIHKINGGLSSARNAGLEIANGDLISFIDSDDYIHPEMFSKLVQLIKNYEADFSSCGNLRVYSHEEELRNEHDSKEILFNKKDLLTRAITDSFESLCLNVYKRELIIDMRFKPGIAFEDVEFSLRLAQKANLAIKTSFVGYAYFINPKGITKVRSSQNKIDRLESFMRNEKAARESFPDLVEIAEKKSAATAVSALQWALILRDVSDSEISRLKGIVESYLRKETNSLKPAKRILAKTLLSVPMLVVLPGRFFVLFEKARKLFFK